jgi:SAM-dependent methyltransferase
MDKELKPSFDVSEYEDIINRSTRLVGYSYDYFAKLRFTLFLAEIGSERLEDQTISLLDYGCGIGKTEFIFRQLGLKAALIGVDTCSKSIDLAKGLSIANARFIFLEHESLPLPDHSIDYIYTNGTFHHIHEEERSPILQELFRIIKPGGEIFIFENNALNPVTCISMKRSPIDQGIKPLTAAYLRGLLSKSGFAIVKTHYYFFFPKWLSLFQKFEPLLAAVPLGAQFFIRATVPAHP